MDNFQQVLSALQAGDVIAYPTEGVFGVGCDPDNQQAIEKLLAVKQRPVDKGLILIAAHYEQIQPYIDESQLTELQLAKVKQSWPGPVTWIMPASATTSAWVTGQFDSVAVRVTDHPQVVALCEAFNKPITSTSANLSGQAPCMTHQEVAEQLSQCGVCILTGHTGGRNNPTEIRDARTDRILRAG